MWVATGLECPCSLPAGYDVTQTNLAGKPSSCHYTPSHVPSAHAGAIVQQGAVQHAMKTAQHAMNNA